MEDEGPFYKFKKFFLSGILDRAKVSGLLQERVERQSGVKVHELHSYPFLHKLQPLPEFMSYTSDRERSLILPFVGEIKPSTEKSESKRINIDDLSLCDSEYFKLNRCVIEGLSKDNKDKNSPKFSRLSKCKYHYIIYVKCLNKRDKTIDKLIFKHEMDHLNSLSSNKRSEYLETLERAIAEFKANSDGSKDPSEKFALNRTVQLMSDRLRRLRKAYS